MLTVPKGEYMSEEEAEAWDALQTALENLPYAGPAPTQYGTIKIRHHYPRQRFWGLTRDLNVIYDRQHAQRHQKGWVAVQTMTWRLSIFVAMGLGAFAMVLGYLTLHVTLGWR
jgi:hypothetical protein